MGIVQAMVQVAEMADAQAGDLEDENGIAVGLHRAAVADVSWHVEHKDIVDRERVPRRDAFCGSTFDTSNTSSRRPLTASPTISSASPYISAVSIWLTPSSMPLCSAAMA